ncbi:MULTISPECIES: hypothetical protein [Alphaproteobacteria]|uniref:DUF1127 domain-containing protein n=2 Tax=Alphaproteobacteria TaxID=28211 RepID=A0A512HD79_9HYPH|nr:MULTISPECIES: hypothetical protein [Alphaproteobacteria]GEO83407.1 hypothetical protein RNA01_03390 [Ciceribacter naphthalenivorans]GLR23020.1 hypothetical protein GCM10007920_28080 [Ciceribacter naphthalenivorans]GLT05876.1 hypothetical protein GCM10007926_28080 [Sphingomonas psychrolutea]
MLIGSLLNLVREAWSRHLSVRGIRASAYARSELANLPPELKRDIGWPPERYSTKPARPKT